MIYYQDNAVTIHHGCALDVLKKLPDEQIQCVVTSPPYWGLRDYGTAKWEGGAENHKHDTVPARNGRGGSGAPGKQTEGAFPSAFYAESCSCGATRIDNQLGLEKTPDEYVAKMVEVFREVRRVLKDDGTVWLNLGDSYASTGRSDRRESPGIGARQEMKAPGREIVWKAGGGSNFAWTLPGGQKPKDLVGIPWRVAFALQADGWYLRSDIIWSKPNPMPESVRDRPTKSHEYIFLLSKNKRYFFDQEAVRDPYAPASFARWDQDIESQEGSWRVPGKTNGSMKAVGGHGFRGRQGGSDRVGPQSCGVGSEVWLRGAGRNIRSVWTIATQPYSEAHFATFPQALVKPCILAGSRPGDTICDPFAGSGVALYVAKELGRRGIGIELKADYIDLAAKRLRQEVLKL